LISKRRLAREPHLPILSVILLSLSVSLLCGTVALRKVTLKMTSGHATGLRQLCARNGTCFSPVLPRAVAGLVGPT